MAEDDKTTAADNPKPEGQGPGPSPARPKQVEEEDRFSGERLRSSDGPAIVRGAYGNDEPPPGADSSGALAGALHDVDDEDGLTRSEIRSRVEDFLAHKDTTTEQEA